MPSYRPYDHISIREQAERAANFYLTGSPRPIHVFPCGHTGHAKEFRGHLAALLCFGLPEDRKRNEELCAEIGYPFVEIDPVDYT